MVTGGGHKSACHGLLANHWLPLFLCLSWFADVTAHGKVPSAMAIYGTDLFRPVVLSTNQNTVTTSTRYGRPTQGRRHNFLCKSETRTIKWMTHVTFDIRIIALPIFKKQMHMACCIMGLYKAPRAQPATKYAKIKLRLSDSVDSTSIGTSAHYKCTYKC